jgi:sensor histidine kinase YesM
VSIQDIFYLLGSIYLTVGILVMIFIAIVLLMMAKSISHLSKMIEEKIGVISDIAEDPSSYAIKLGSNVAGSAIKKVKEMITSEKKQKKE